MLQKYHFTRVTVTLLVTGIFFMISNKFMFSSQEEVNYNGLSSSSSKSSKSLFSKRCPARDFSITSYRGLLMEKGDIPNATWNIVEDPSTEAHLTNLDLPPIPFLPMYKNPCWFEKYPRNFKKTYGENLYRVLFKNLVNPMFKQLESILGRREAHWRLRCLPYFFLAGVSKSGTTDLYHTIEMHPKVVVPTRKEPTYFNRIRWNVTQHYMTSSLNKVHLPHPVPRPFRHYVELYDMVSEEIRREPTEMTEDGCYFKHELITGDGTPNYLWDFDAWTLIPANKGLTEPKVITAHFLHMLNPEARIILILRNPVDRIWSEYRAFSIENEGDKDSNRFHELVTKGIGLMTQCLSKRTVRSCVYDREINGQTEPVRLRVGMYQPFIQDWLKVFNRDRVFVVQMEHYSQHKAEVTNQIFEYLGLEPLRPEKIEAKKLKHVTQLNSIVMHNDTRTLLENFYKPWNEKLAHLLKNKMYLWL